MEENTSISPNPSSSREKDENEEHNENKLLNAEGEGESSGCECAFPGGQNSHIMTTLLEDKIRRKLKFFFMNPIEKWEAKRRFPYKFVVQVIKIILVTVQLCLFAHNNYMHVNYTWNNKITFSHLFLQNWDTINEVPAYPPATGPLALYTQDEFYDAIDYALDGFYNITKAIGSYSYIYEDNSKGPTTLCLNQYKEGTIFGFNESYVFNSEIEEKCLNITREDINSSKALLMEKKIDVNFSALVNARLEFVLKTVNLKAAGPTTPPDCYQFNVTIDYDNSNFDGQMLVSLNAVPQRLTCKGDTHYITNSQIEHALRTLLNLLVIGVSTASLVLCSRAIYKAQLLKNETIKFFRNHYGKVLSFEGRLEFLNFWYIMIIMNDVLIIIGSGIKQKVEGKHFGGDHWDTCSMLLGTGNLLVWFGVLRYLGFFKNYNVVILTLKKATPKVMRFLICAILIYAGFVFCGWLVFGPYHIKFRSLATTSECLFALINGDEIFATFSMTTFKSPILWWYFRIYLYSFSILYIYVVLSLFISVIMDAYDSIKIYYRDGFPKNDLQSFIATCRDEASSGIYREDTDENNLTELIGKFCCCRKRPVYGSFSGTSISKFDSPCGPAICI